MKAATVAMMDLSKEAFTPRSPPSQANVASVGEILRASGHLGRYWKSYVLLCLHSFLSFALVNQSKGSYIL